MERIVIEVADATAKEWQLISPKVKSQLERSIEQLIEITSRTIKETRLQMAMDRASAEAAKNGLTEEILEKLLNEED